MMRAEAITSVCLGGMPPRTAPGGSDSFRPNRGRSSRLATLGAASNRGNRPMPAHRQHRDQDNPRYEAPAGLLILATSQAHASRYLSPDRGRRARVLEAPGTGEDWPVRERSSFP